MNTAIDSSSVMVPKVIISSPLECAIWSYWDGLKCPKKNINALMLFLKYVPYLILILFFTKNEFLVFLVFQ